MRIKAEFASLCKYFVEKQDKPKVLPPLFCEKSEENE